MALLPENFADLEPLADWAEPTERGRCARRRAASPEALQGFYDTVKPRLEAVLDYLDGFPLGAMPEREQRLLNLALAMAEVTFAVEKYRGVGRVPLGISLEEFVPLHDLPAGA